MDSSPTQTASSTRESSPLTSPPASTPGASPKTPSLIVTLRVSSRLATQRAQITVKRAIDDVDSSADDVNSSAVEAPSKRSRLTTSPVVEDDTQASSQTIRSEPSQSTLNRDGHVEDSQEQPTQEPHSSIDITEKGTDAPRTQAIGAVSCTYPSASKPLVWANARGSLCEALPYFKSYQGSLHSANVVAQGFLVDQEADEGDMFGAQVIISTV